MTRFRESVSLRSYGQINPLQDYVNEGWAMFREMLETIALEVVLNLMNVKLERKVQENKNGFTINAKDVEQKPAVEQENPQLKVAETKEEQATQVSAQKAESSTSVDDAPVAEAPKAESAAKAEEKPAEDQPKVDAKASLNITDIDENATAAKENNFEDIHTN